MDSAEYDSPATGVSPALDLHRGLSGQVPRAMTKILYITYTIERLDYDSEEVHSITTVYQGMVNQMMYITNALRDLDVVIASTHLTTYRSLDTRITLLRAAGLRVAQAKRIREYALEICTQRLKRAAAGGGGGGRRLEAGRKLYSFYL
ncbi:hypothetical protein EVAR_60187_1 [Eumeta japonica]|uniref:Uncharacterized protein n=1 Tax=Eumeta variegata TaxID=151549 RepID=A0A4C1SEY6_EUMVA|nr:hypothetical protein EVAR_60187_1 [Eumeta japonica]